MRDHYDGSDLHRHGPTRCRTRSDRLRIPLRQACDMVAPPPQLPSTHVAICKVACVCTDGGPKTDSVSDNKGGTMLEGSTQKPHGLQACRHSVSVLVRFRHKTSILRPMLSVRKETW